MRFLAASIDQGERRLGVVVPPFFSAFLLAHDLATYVPWKVLRPEEWHCVEGDDKYRGLPGVVFGEDVGGGYYFLRRTAIGAPALSETIWRWDHHAPQKAERVARTIEELPEVLERRATEFIDSKTK